MRAFAARLTKSAFWSSAKTPPDRAAPEDGKKSDEAEPREAEAHLPRIEIPVRDPAPDALDRQTAFDRGRQLAREDLWDTLCDEILEADRARRLTPGRVPVADLLSEGARADAFEAARSAIARNEPRKAQVVISALQMNEESRPDCPAMASLVAMLHVDLARVWRGDATLRRLAANRRGPHDRHLRAALEIADRFSPFDQDLPLWAALRCAALDGDPAPAQRVADDYEDLIDLRPTSPEPMLALGRDLLPGRFGTWEAVDLQARRTAARTADLWGAGGYAWVWIGALSNTDRLATRLDTGFFNEALHDILAQCPGDQHMVNRLAAFTGLTLGDPAGADDVRSRAAKAFDWIAADRWRELHPVVWADAATPGRKPDPEESDEARKERGLARAYSTIAQRFAKHMDRGGRVRFGEDGLQMV